MQVTAAQHTRNQQFNNDKQKQQRYEQTNKQQ